MLVLIVNYCNPHAGLGFFQKVTRVMNTRTDCNVAGHLKTVKATLFNSVMGNSTSSFDRNHSEETLSINKNGLSLCTSFIYPVAHFHTELYLSIWSNLFNLSVLWKYSWNGIHCSQNSSKLPNPFILSVKCFHLNVYNKTAVTTYGG